MAVFDKITTLANQLFPKGRAFKNVFGGDREKLIFAISSEWERLWNAMLSLMNSAIPDVNGFDESDASAWERFYGMNDGGLAGLTLEDRRLAILQKMNFPNGQPARQHFKFIEEQLRLAGFDVYVFENRFPVYPSGYETKTPLELLSSDLLGPQHGDVQHGDTQHQDLQPPSYFTLIQNQHGDFQHGDVQHGSYYEFNNKVANYITAEADTGHDIGSNYRSTFFIGGTPVGTIIEIPKEKEKMFRQLVLRMKPAQTVGFLFINFV